MTPDHVVKLLGLFGVHNASKTKRSGWVVSECALGPWKHDGGKSSPEVFGVKNGPGDPKANCFACGWHGTLGGLVIEMRHMNKAQPRIEADWGQAFALIEEAEVNDEFDFDIPGIEETMFGPKEGLHEFPEWWLDSFAGWSSVKWARDYLKTRNVSDEIATVLDLRVDTKEGRVCFPVRDFAGKLVGLHGRAVDEQREPRYRMYLQGGHNNPIVWLGEQWVDRSKPIVVVEGPFDLAAVLPVYGNVVSPLFSNPSVAKIKRMADAFEWITFYDRGAGGDAGREKVASVLTKDHTLHHLKPPKGFKDPGAMPHKMIAEMLSPIVQLTTHWACT